MPHFWPTAVANDGSAAALTADTTAAPSNSRNLTARVLSAAVGLPILAGVIWLGNPLFAVMVMVAALIATWEFHRMARAAHGDSSGPLLFAAVIGLLIDAYLSGQAFPAILTATTFLSLLWAVIRYERQGEGFGWAWTIGGVLYIGWLSSHYLGLRELPHGREWVLFAFTATFLNDTAAYTVGRILGNRRFTPRLSPGKTWEGAVGALIVTTVGAPVAALILGLAIQPHLFLLGACISIVAQTGDLAESMLKRLASMKDVSALVPGHGGFLDRMDSLVFVGPLVYYYVRWCVAS